MSSAPPPWPLFKLGDWCTARYRNHRGDVAARTFRPTALFYGAEPPWHPEPGWILVAYDEDKQAERSFALSGFLEIPPS